MSKLITLLLLCVSLAAMAQSQLTEHTLKLDAPDNSPPASIEALAWLSGRWMGEGFGGALEENWNPPLGGAMVATFRMVEDEQPQFYEICVIEPEGNTLVYKVKHFNPGLKGWEEKDRAVAFPAGQAGTQRCLFPGPHDGARRQYLHPLSGHETERRQL